MDILFTLVPPAGIEAIGGPPSYGDLPTRWRRWRLEWQTKQVPEAVFIGQTMIPSVEELGRANVSQTGEIEAFVFGFRVDLTQANSPDPGLPKGHVLEFEVVERHGDDLPTKHRLKQTRSVTYSATDEPRDYMIGTDFDWMAAPCLNRPPAWKPEQGYWPTRHGKPMVFCEQWAIPENKTTDEHLTCDMSVFLFAASSSGGTGYKITTQHTQVQTAGDHYAEEA